MYYEIDGTGEPLVLIHGGIGAIEMFSPLVPISVRQMTPKPVRVNTLQIEPSLT